MLLGKAHQNRRGSNFGIFHDAAKGEHPPRQLSISTPIKTPVSYTHLFEDNPTFGNDPIDIPTSEMSDGEETASNPPVGAADEVEVSANTTAGSSMSVLDALKGVLKIALIHDGLARGLREASKALDRRQAHIA
ncbi:40S ribosomal protein S12 [Histoplasma capsulatum H143]|uniref:40S ribosomal protein S12 n=1 Tax=Ajellomyces capsulatus (strain H143) TaxID=544712 RepID=C6H1U7_AJECH|nr:40S ribosomal protein S12 [Histoplasma capsulatum H143]